MSRLTRVQARATGIAAILAGVLAAGLGAATATTAARAGERADAPVIRMAAVTDAWEQSFGRSGVPGDGRGSVGSGTGQLVQNTAAGPSETEPREVILAVFPKSAPRSAEDDVARDYNLKIVRRVTLPGLGMRIAGYSVLDATPPAAVIGRLRADGRIKSAQLNLTYLPREPEEGVTTEIGKLNAPMPKRAAAAARSRREPPARPARMAKPAPPAAKPRGHAPVRVSAADVLAGGL